VAGDLALGVLGSPGRGEAQEAAGATAPALAVRNLISGRRFAVARGGRGAAGRSRGRSRGRPGRGLGRLLGRQPHLGSVGRDAQRAAPWPWLRLRGLWRRRVGRIRWRRSGLGRAFGRWRCGPGSRLGSRRLGARLVALPHLGAGHRGRRRRGRGRARGRCRGRSRRWSASGLAPGGSSARLGTLAGRCGALVDRGVCRGGDRGHGGGVGVCPGLRGLGPVEQLVVLARDGGDGIARIVRDGFGSRRHRRRGGCRPDGCGDLTAGRRCGGGRARLAGGWGLRLTPPGR
jgi:hypothetical protein